MPLATTLRSIVEASRANWPLQFHVLVADFPEKQREKVYDSLPKASASIQWVEVDVDRFDGFPTLPWISKMSYARLLIPQALSNLIPRVVYLDTDILVLDDLAALWGTDLDGAVLGAVLDRADALIKRKEPGYEGVPCVMHYFNAGVLLVDLIKWRKNCISEKAFKYLIQNPRSPFSDQDALNVACDGLWKRLDPKWNYHDHYGVRFADLNSGQRPSIIHFIGRRKPWNPTIPNLNAYYYDAFRRRTRFARTYNEKLCDLSKGMWSRIKRVCKQYRLVRAIRSRTGYWS